MLAKRQFEIFIDASPSDVWDAVVDDAKFRAWCSVFHDGSHYVGGWSTGDTIRFLGPADDGEYGMVAVIEDSRPGEFVSIKHIGMVMAGVDDTTSDEVLVWAPLFENYTLIPLGGGTKFVVDVEFQREHESMFSEMWPRALDELKRVAESGL